MFEKVLKFTGVLSCCPDCRKQPKPIHVLGKDKFYLSCTFCGLRTPKMSSLQGAVQFWEDMPRDLDEEASTG